MLAAGVLLTALGAGLVTRGRSAQTRPVRLNGPAMAAAAKWLGDYHRFWEQNLDQLGAYASELQRKETDNADQ